MDKEMKDFNSNEESRIKEVFAKRKSEISPYNYSWFNPVYRFIEQSKEKNILRALSSHKINSFHDKKILDVGCGNGDLLGRLMLWGAEPDNLFGIDLMGDDIERAQKVFPHCHVKAGNAEKMPYPENSFDIVFQSTVFTSIQTPEMKKNIAQEMNRVVKDDGLIIWYDFFVNNPLNPSVKGIKKKEIRLLFPGYEIDFKKVTLAPPILRLLAPVSYLFSYMLEKIPFLRTHLLALIFRRNLIR